jgi:hypothetical protein
VRFVKPEAPNEIDEEADDHESTHVFYYTFTLITIILTM